MAWLTGWTRRKIKIVENLTVSDYQMKLIIHKSGLGPDTSIDIYLGGRCRDDFADLRFTGPDQTTLLSYWIESITGITPNLVTTIWIKIPTLIPTNNIYIYYDNPIASPVSNGDNTFIFFDDFIGSSLDTSKWMDDTASATIANSIMTFKGASPAKIINSTQTFSSNIAIRSKIKYTTASDYIINHGFHNSAGTHWGMVYLAYSPQNLLYSKGGSSTTEVATNWPVNSWFISDINIVSGTSLSGYKDGIQITNSPITINVPNTTDLRAFFVARLTSGGTGIESDWVVIRKYASPEPIFGISGTEELNITAIDMILNTNTCAGPCQIIAGVTWQNMGSSSVTFTPAVLIDNTVLAYGTDITISAGGTNSATITTPTLSIGTHQICPYPN